MAKAEFTPLTVEDFRNPLFDKQRIVRRTIPAVEADEPYLDDETRPKGKVVIEGTTFTDNFRLVGFTYFVDDGTVTVRNTENVLLFSGSIYSSEDFEKALKRADKKQHKLESSKSMKSK